MTLLRGLWVAWLGWLLLAVACGGPVQRVELRDGKGDQAAVEPSVLVVTLTGKLGSQEVARCHRSLREAIARGCKHVVFRLDGAGSMNEDVPDLQSLFDHVQSASAEQSLSTVAVLRGRVTYGAAALALVCDRVFVLPNAEWGEVQKNEPELLELLSENPEDARGQQIDAVREAMAARLAAKKEKLSPDAEKLALAMLDPRIQIVLATVREGGIDRQRVLTTADVTALQAAGTKLLGDQPLTRPLMLTAAQADEFRLATALSGLDQLADALTIDPQTIGELTDNWAEHMVGWLELLQPFLLVIGFLLLIVELKTPGIGFAGLFGVLFLGLALFYSYLVGLAEITEILVFFLGLAAIAVEIFLLPGTIVFGGLGFLFLVMALVLSRQSFVLPSNAVEEGLFLVNLGQLTLLFVSVLVLGAVMWRVLPRIPFFNRVFLLPPEPAPSTAGTGSGLGVNAGLTALVGRVGTTATVLRPSGAMEIDGQRIDVATEGEFLPAGTKVRVLYVNVNLVVVAAVEPEAPGAGPVSRHREKGSVGVVLLLLIVGLALLVAEVMLVSFGVILALAGIALLSAVFVAFQSSVTFGAIIVGTEAVLTPLVLRASFKLLPKTKLGKELILAGTAGTAAAADPGLTALLDKDGVTLTALRPAGYARIDGRKIDVTTRGEMLDADVPVVVLDVSANRVVVGRR
ncbi:MAG: NfeD family protein [Planctomycetota bacterium]